MPLSTRFDRDSVVARFMSHVEKQSSGCWEWQGKHQWLDPRKRTPHLYGLVIHRQKRTFAHRHSYELFVGPIPQGMFVLHSCDNPPCVNPDHLRVGTMKDNGADMSDRGRAHCQSVTHCKQGHEYTPENTVYSRQRNDRLRRHCRICRRDAWRKHQGFTGRGRHPLRIV